MNELNADTGLILAVQIITIGLIIQNATTFIFIIASIVLFFAVIRQVQKRDRIIEKRIKEYETKLEKSLEK